MTVGCDPVTGESRPAAQLQVRMLAAMGTFLASTALFFVIATAINVPLLFFALRQGRRRTAITFTLAGLAIAATCGFLDASAERLIDQCIAAGNPRYNCRSYGERGMQAVFVAGYAIVSWLNAYWLSAPLRKPRRGRRGRRAARR